MKQGSKDKTQLMPRSGEDFWVFGYGSLMWHPGFPHLEVQIAKLHGYHRRFCVYSHVYRGTPKCPGLVFGLDRGGSCRGLAFRVPAAEAQETMDYLYEREMINGVYTPQWLDMTTEAGTINAIAFVVDQNHEQYAGRLTPEEIIELILQGRGAAGHCSEYLENTVHHLEALGLGDRSLKRLLHMVQARCD